MKTARFIMCFVAAAAMLFAACGKDEEETSTNTQGSTSQVVAADNQAIVSGSTWRLVPQVAVSLEGNYYIDADGYLAGSEEPTFHLRSDVMANVIGRTFSLSEAVNGIDYGFGINYGEDGYIQQDCHEGNINGMLGEENIEAAVFSSGSSSASLDDNFTYTISGTTTSGVTVSVRLVVPVTGIEDLPW